MKEKTYLKGILALALVSVLLSSSQLSAQQRGRGIGGDWLLKAEFDGRPFEFILSFSRDQEGNRTGYRISGFGGLSELKNLKFDAGKLSFAYDRRNRDGDTNTSTFSGTIQDGQLSGTLSSDRGYVQLAQMKVSDTPTHAYPVVAGNRIFVKDQETVTLWTLQ